MTCCTSRRGAVEVPVLGANRVLAILQRAVCSQRAYLPVLFNASQPQAIIGPLKGHRFGPLLIQVSLAPADCLHNDATLKLSPAFHSVPDVKRRQGRPAGTAISLIPSPCTPLPKTPSWARCQAGDHSLLLLFATAAKANASPLTVKGAFRETSKKQHTL